VNSIDLDFQKIALKGSNIIKIDEIDKMLYGYLKEISPNLTQERFDELSRIAKERIIKEGRV
jgi:hypothetical protein